MRCSDNDRNVFRLVMSNFEQHVLLILATFCASRMARIWPERSLPLTRGDPIKADDQDSDIREEYDFSAGVKGKYAARFAEGSNVVVLDPDVAAEFRTRKAVNDALRAQLENGRRASGHEGRRR